MKLWPQVVPNLELPVLAQPSNADSCLHVWHVFSFHKMSSLCPPLHPSIKIMLLSFQAREGKSAEGKDRAMEPADLSIERHQQFCSVFQHQQLILWFSRHNWLCNNSIQSCPQAPEVHTRSHRLKKLSPTDGPYFKCQSQVLNHLYFWLIAVNWGFPKPPLQVW